MRLKSGLIVGVCLVLAACAKDEDKKKSNGGDESIAALGNLSYEIRDNGCQTGAHRFATMEELCQALQNNAVNRKCAVDIRQSLFQDRCPGQSFTAF